MLWTGSAATAIDLNPAGFTASQAEATNGAQQVGDATTPTTAGGYQHAVLWAGSAASAVDLDPAASTTSQAFGVGGAQQVGAANGPATAASYHAMLWAGSAASGVDLNPAGFNTSHALATNGSMQVGYGLGTASGFQTNALFWSGTAASYVDLQSVLPATFLSSEATSISGNNIYGYARDTSNNYHAVVWNVAPTVPEPAGISLAVAAVLALGRRRRA